MKRTLTSLTVGAMLARIASARSAHAVPVGGQPIEAANSPEKLATLDEGTAFKPGTKTP